jgi:hypothetical protein
MSKVILIELNEINFEAVRYYAGQGALPTFAKLIAQHGYAETTSEATYEKLEPWIQWVTAHTGLSFNDHGVFRLGDIVNHDIPQIWDMLEGQGFTVGAISPMNAKNKLKQSPFFVPDPWTKTPTSGPKLLARLHQAIGQVVGDNTKGKITPQSAFWLLVGLLRFARPRNYLRYFNLIVQSRSKPWSRPMFLDLFLADIFVRLNRRHKVDFASLFLNAGAHIQHHYMFNSPAYAGVARNPDWYIAPKSDPLLEVYTIYDVLLAQIMDAMPQNHLLIATGLHQDPHPTVTYYWRLKDHMPFLRKIGINAQIVEPLMSRDFIVRFESCAAAALACDRLNSAKDNQSEPLFEVDNRGKDLFVMLVYPHDIPKNMSYTVGNAGYTDLSQDVSFVAIKNGQHNGLGYLIDTRRQLHSEAVDRIELRALPQIIADAVKAKPV